MSDEGNSVREGFVRQRRSLMAISLVLLFAVTSELSVNKLNIFGTELLIRNPVVVNASLWIALCYWLWRYYVYFRDWGDKGFSLKVGERIGRLVNRWSTRKFNADAAWRQKLIKDVEEQLTRTQTGNPQLQADLKSPHREWRLPDALLIGQRRFGDMEVQARLTLFVSRNDLLTSAGEGYGRFEINGLRAMIMSLRAAGYVLTHTRILTEFYLPYLIAAAPVFYLIYKHW